MYYLIQGCTILSIEFKFIDINKLDAYNFVDRNTRNHFGLLAKWIIISNKYTKREIVFSVANSINNTISEITFPFTVCCKISIWYTKYKYEG